MVLSPSIVTLTHCFVVGSRFDIRDYNEAILSTGRVPMTVARRAVQRYIDANKPPTSGSEENKNKPIFLLFSVTYLMTSLTFN